MKWFQKKTWNYVGTVEAYSVVVDENGKEIPGGHRKGYWILSERGDGQRRVKRIGEPGYSALANSKRAEVEAWLAGGPLPELHNQPKRTADLKVFPGGAA